jgi:hypothetical protein
MQLGKTEANRWPEGARRVIRGERHFGNVLVRHDEVLSIAVDTRSNRMERKDGRISEQPYRVRVGTIWYWVDPTVPAAEIEPGDTVVIYPVAGDPTLAILRRPPEPGGSHVAPARPVDFSTLEDERFTVAARDIAALHLAAVDEDQT